MKYIRNLVAAILVLGCVFGLTGCDSFYELFVDEDDTSSGVYIAVYDKSLADEEIAGIPDVPFMKGDLRSKIGEYDLSFEVTLSLDLETKDEASLSFYYYHNKDDAEAADYCEIGNSYMGIYTLEGDKLTFTFEPEGYNTVIYNVGSDYAGLDEFKKFSFAEDGSCGIWAYANAPWEYEETATILEDVVKDLPAKVELTLDGSRITDWKISE